jgi:hypothetical protein
MGQIANIDDCALEQIKSLEDYCLTLPQVDIKTIERFIGSMYCREIIIPKGVTLTSRVYKRGYVDIMLSGDITISDTNGVYRLTGLNILEGPAGRKRAGYAHEETRWLTVHDMFDINKNPIEDISFEQVPQYKEYEAQNAKQSFLQFLTESKLLENDVRDQSENEPYEEIQSDSYYIAESPIEGKGIFSSVPFRCGEIIGPMVINGIKTQLGRYTNHSGYPNAIYNGENMMTIRAIETGQEITTCYQMSPRIKS